MNAIQSLKINENGRYKHAALRDIAATTSAGRAESEVLKVCGGCKNTFWTRFLDAKFCQDACYHLNTIFERRA